LSVTGLSYVFLQGAALSTFLHHQRSKLTADSNAREFLGSWGLKANSESAGVLDMKQLLAVEKRQN
jgi:hypothetical protein